MVIQSHRILKLYVLYLPVYLLYITNPCLSNNVGRVPLDEVDVWHSNITIPAIAVVLLAVLISVGFAGCIAIATILLRKNKLVAFDNHIICDC